MTPASLMLTPLTSTAYMLLMITVRSLAALAIGEAFLLVLRRRSASAARRHTVLLVTFAALAALPLFARILPDLRIPAAASLGDAGDTSTIAAGDTVSASGHHAHGWRTKRMLSALLTALDAERPTMDHAAAATQSAAWKDFTLAAFTLIWLTGASAISLRYILAYVSLHKVARRCYHDVTDSDWTARLRRLADSSPNAPRGIRLKQAIDAEDVPFAAPVTFGFVRPTILLPAASALDSWASERIEAVLRHEIAHIERADYLGQAIANLTCALYWFNPWVWRNARRMGDAAESASDDQVLVSGADATEYAAHLLGVARTLRDAALVYPNHSQPGRFIESAALGIIKPSKTVEARMTSVLSTNCDRTPIARRALCTSTFLALVLTLPLATIHVATALPPPHVKSASPKPNPRDEKSVDTLLHEVQAATLALKSMTADFTYSVSSVKSQQMTTGSLRMMKPNFARVMFSYMAKPAFPNLIASDGKTVSTFTPESFRPDRKFNDGPFDSIVGAQQASGLAPGGGKIGTDPAGPQGENVHLWDAAPIQAFFNPINAMRNNLYVGDLHEMHYEGYQKINGVTYQVLEHHFTGGNIAGGENSDFEQHLYIGSDKLIHGYILEFTSGSKPGIQIAWLKNIQTNVPMTVADFAFTPPAATAP